jgi:hypothetical protein
MTVFDQPAPSQPDRSKLIRCSYNTSPPKVKTMTTNGGTYRLNPNLYVRPRTRERPDLDWGADVHPISNCRPKVRSACPCSGHGPGQAGSSVPQRSSRSSSRSKR